MILNPFALTLLFTAAVSLLLMVGAAGAAVMSHRQLERCEGADEKAQAESRLHLAFLLLVTAFMLRLASWPLFYILLQSLVPLVPGAMCIFGVTRVMPGFLTLIQTLKPTAFFLIGGWLIVHRIDLSLKTRSLARASSWLLAWVSAVAALDALAEIAFVLDFTPPGVAVSCCTAMGDIVVPSAPMLPLPLFGDRYNTFITAGYHGFSLGLAGLIALLLWRMRGKEDRLARRGVLVWPAVLAAVTGVVAYVAFGESLGPQLMGLPDHHCLYCMLQYRPVSILIVALLILGLFCAIWPAILNDTIATDEVRSRLPGVIRKLYQWAFFCVLASWLLASTLS